MLINLIGMILNNAGRAAFDGAILDDNGSPMSATESLHTMIMEYAKVVNGGTSSFITVPREFMKKADDCEANARLISAAPDLLKALQMILWDADGKEWEKSDLSDNDWDARQNDARDIARTAIAKALGLDVPQKFDDDGVSELDLIGGES